MIYIDVCMYVCSNECMDFSDISQSDYSKDQTAIVYSIYHFYICLDTRKIRFLVSFGKFDM